MSTHPPSLQVRARCDVGQDLRLALEGTDPLLLSELPGDPGWTPEALEVAAVAAAFVAAFRAASRDARGVWSRIEVHASGLMEPVGDGQRLAGIGLDVMLELAPGAPTDAVEHALHQAEREAPLALSVACPVHMRGHIRADWA